MNNKNKSTNETNNEQNQSSALPKIDFVIHANPKPQRVIIIPKSKLQKYIYSQRSQKIENQIRIQSFSLSSISNASTTCKPKTTDVAIQYKPEYRSQGTQTDFPESKAPVFIPVPFSLYKMEFPIPVILPLPVPVFIPKNLDDEQENKNELNNLVSTDNLPEEPKTENLQFDEMNHDYVSDNIGAEIELPLNFVDISEICEDNLEYNRISLAQNASSIKRKTINDDIDDLDDIPLIKRLELQASNN